MSSWKRIYRTRDRIKAEIVKDVLQDRGITAITVNKQDSAYVVLGEFEIHVPVDEVIEALKIINDDIDFK